jgi:hypothetical protein
MGIKIKPFSYFIALFALFIHASPIKAETIANKIKDKNLIVVINDEKDPYNISLIDAFDSIWKICPYKFMSMKDAEKLFSDKQNIFLFTSSSLISGKLKILQISLSIDQGKWNAFGRIEKLTPVTTHGTAIVIDAAQVSSDSYMWDIAAEEAELQISNLVWQLNQEEKLLNKYTKVDNVRYFGLEKKNINSKSTLFIDKNQYGINDEKVNRIEVIKENLNRPD